MKRTLFKEQYRKFKCRKCGSRVALRDSNYCKACKDEVEAKMFSGICKLVWITRRNNIEERRIIE